MTNREALYELKRKLPDKESNPLFAEAFDMAIKALEKQIPKKIEKGHIYWACPNCKKEMPTYRECCDHCGQRLDWSDN